MKVIVLNKGQYEPADEQFANFLSKPEGYRNQIYSQRKIGNILEFIPRIEQPGCIVFSVDSVAAGCSLALIIPSIFRIDREQIFLEVTKDVYYSGWLAFSQGNGRWLDPSTRPPFRYLSEGNFRKAVAFKKWEVIGEMNLSANSTVTSLIQEFPDADRIIEVWCMEWEYYDRIVFMFYFDYSEHCFWSCNRKAREIYDCVTTAENLPLSERTRERVREMSRWYRTCLDWSNPGKGSIWSDEELKSYLKAESDLREDIRKELGDEFEIID